MNRASEPRPGEPSGVWVSRTEIHDLRDNIHAIRVGLSLIQPGNPLDDAARLDVYREIEGAINKLTSSAVFNTLSSQ